MGRAPGPSRAIASGPGLWPPPSLGSPPPPGRVGEEHSPGVKGTEDIQARKGGGPTSRRRTFLHQGLVCRPGSFGGDTLLNRSSRSHPPPPGPVCGGAPSCPPRVRGLLLRERSASLRRPPGVELRSHRQRLALRSSGGRGPAGFLQLGRTQSGGGGRGSFQALGPAGRGGGDAPSIRHPGRVRSSWDLAGDP